MDLFLQQTDGEGFGLVMHAYHADGQNDKAKTFLELAVHK